MQKYNQGVLLIILLGLFQILLAKGNSLAHKTMKFRDEDGFRHGLVQGSHDYFSVLLSLFHLVTLFLFASFLL